MSPTISCFDERSRKYLRSLDQNDATDATRFGPKAATLAMLRQRGLPVPEGVSISAELYREHLRSTGLMDLAIAVFQSEEVFSARQHALKIRRALYDAPFSPSVEGILRDVWRTINDQFSGSIIVRSSALAEDRDESSFAGQFESFPDIGTEADFLTAVRACWASLWSVRALRYMGSHEVDPSDLAMAVICQRLISPTIAGGGLSKTAEDHMVLTAAPGLSTGIAQGEVTPERFVLDRNGIVIDWTPGHTPSAHQDQCIHHAHDGSQFRGESDFATIVKEPTVSAAQITELAALLTRSEALFEKPVEIEWAADDSGTYLVQVRPLVVRDPIDIGEEWPKRPCLTGHPAGIGVGSGRARIINCECQLSTVAPGDVLVTKVAGPSLSQYISQVAGVVAELGGSTSHLASIGRERGIPMVLGVPDATHRIPSNANVLVDGVSGTVRWKPELNLNRPGMMAALGEVSAASQE